METNTRDYTELLYEELSNPNFAISYLNAGLEESQEVFLLHLRDVIAACGGMTRLSTNTELARESLYRMLSENGNPELSSITKVLSAVGLRLAVAKE